MFWKRRGKLSRNLLSVTPTSTQFSLLLFLNGALRDAIRKMSHSSPPLDPRGMEFYDQYFKKKKKKKNNSEGNSFKYRKIKPFFGYGRSALRAGAFSEIIQPPRARTHSAHLETACSYVNLHFHLYMTHSQGNHSKEEEGTSASRGPSPRRPLPWRAPVGYELNHPRKILRAICTLKSKTEIEHHPGTESWQMEGGGHRGQNPPSKRLFFLRPSVSPLRPVLPRRVATGCVQSSVSGEETAS